MDSANKSSETSGGGQFPDSNKQDPNQDAKLATQEAARVRVRKGSGPRTKEGKAKSRQNALKHGIFSDIVVLEGESRAEFDSLLLGLRNDIQPEGTLEAFLVEKLAAIIWRLRRQMIADGAQTLKGGGLVEFERIVGAADLDLLLRFESNLDWAFDRTLNQLERLQQIHNGQPVTTDAQRE